MSLRFIIFLILPALVAALNFYELVTKVKKGPTEYNHLYVVAFGGAAGYSAGVVFKTAQGARHVFEQGYNYVQDPASSRHPGTTEGGLLLHTTSDFSSPACTEYNDHTFPDGCDRGFYLTEGNQVAFNGTSVPFYTFMVCRNSAYTCANTGSQSGLLMWRATGVKVNYTLCADVDLVASRVSCPKCFDPL